MNKIDIPDGLLVAEDPLIPGLRELYWLESPLLDRSDPESSRPAVVLTVPTQPGEEIFVALRSSTEKNGELHEKQPGHGLARDGWFSRGRSINPELWTPMTARPIDLLLDETTFAYVCKDLLLEEPE